jgi:hypothetical protein
MTECCYAECRYAECCGAKNRFVIKIKTSRKVLFLKILRQKNLFFKPTLFGGFTHFYRNLPFLRTPRTFPDSAAAESKLFEADIVVKFYILLARLQTKE